MCIDCLCPPRLPKAPVHGPVRARRWGWLSLCPARSALPCREQAGVSHRSHNLQSNFHYLTPSSARGHLTSFACNAFGAVTLLNPALQTGTGCLGQARAVLCLRTWKHNVCLSVPVRREGRYREFRPGCQPAEQ